MFHNNLMIEGDFVAVRGSEGTQHIPVSELVNPKDKLEIATMYKGLDVYGHKVVKGYGLQVGPSDWVYFPDEGDANVYLEKEFGGDFRPLD